MHNHPFSKKNQKQESKINENQNENVNAFQKTKAGNSMKIDINNMTKTLHCLQGK